MVILNLYSISRDAMIAY